jgi:hypothetical protein
MRALKLLLMLPFFTFYSFGQKRQLPADKKATKETVNLFLSLFTLQNKGVMYGHQDDLMYGSTCGTKKLGQIQKILPVITRLLQVLNWDLSNQVMTGAKCLQ